MPAITWNKVINAPTTSTATHDSVYFYKDFCGMHIVVSSTPSSGPLQLHEIKDYRSVKGNTIIGRDSDGYITSIDNAYCSKVYTYDSNHNMTAVTEIFKGLTINYTVSKSVLMTDNKIASINIA